MPFSLKNKSSASHGLIVKCENLLEALQRVIGVVERRKTMSILSNLLFMANNKELTLLGSDLEIELEAKTYAEEVSKGFPTLVLPAQKLLDICRTLPEESMLELSVDKHTVVFLSGKSRFSLVSAPVAEFPQTPKQETIVKFTIDQGILKSLIERTYFAIPEQDVRHYLNGLLIEVEDDNIMATASDSHRLAIYKSNFVEKDKLLVQVIVPRRAVLELMRLLEKNVDQVTMGLNNNYIFVSGESFIFTSKLIAGRFPNYSRMIPKNWQKKIIVDREALKMALMRVAILSNEFSRSVRLQLQKNVLQLYSNNSENEEAFESLELNYDDESFSILFNANYLLDVLQCMEVEQISLTFKDGGSGVIIEELDNDNSLYLVMPIKK